MIKVIEKFQQTSQTVVLMAQTLQEWKLDLPHQVKNSVHLRAFLKPIGI